MQDFEKTDIFNNIESTDEIISEVLKDVIKAINNKGYDPINQIMGYLKTDNPVYIPRDGGAREKISKFKKDEILEFLLRYFVKEC